jgi:predicted DNA-binding ribbon-helix-helix protein
VQWEKTNTVGEDAMCHVYASQPPSSYECQTRSIRIHGHSTSLRLEAAFWAMLEEMALTEGTDLTKLVTRLHDEVLELNGEIRNFASLLRCCCLVYASHVRDRGAENWGASVQPITM